MLRSQVSSKLRFWDLLVIFSSWMESDCNELFNPCQCLLHFCFVRCFAYSILEAFAPVTDSRCLVMSMQQSLLCENSFANISALPCDSNFRQNMGQCPNSRLSTSHPLIDSAGDVYIHGMHDTHRFDIIMRFHSILTSWSKLGH